MSNYKNELEMSAVKTFQKKVKDYMITEFITVQAEEDIEKDLALILQSKLPHIPVVDEKGAVLGRLIIRELLEYSINNNFINVKVKDLMSDSISIVNESDLISECIEVIEDTATVIDEHKRVVGIFYPGLLVDDLINLKHDFEAFDRMFELYEFCFDTAYEGIALVDEHGYIRLFNEAYGRFTGVDRHDVIGKHCSEVIDGTRLPVVLETGIPERNQPHLLQGQPMIVHRLPIWRNNKIIGAIGVLIYEGVSELFDTLSRARQFFSEEQQGHYYLADSPKEDTVVTFDQIIGESKILGETKKIARKASKTTATILLTGESGVGKDIFAESIHSASPVHEGPYITMNCAAIPDSLLESELFGYEGGAFTGAKKEGKPGKFELAHTGTLFLDEIGEMPLNLQTKLLRILEGQRFERVGGSGTIQVDVRIIAATNKSLTKLIEQGLFREDLYYRLNVIPIIIPALRERKTDIPLLISSFLEKTSRKYNLPTVELSKDTLRLLLSYDWPGNIRELSNIVERIVVLAESTRVEINDLPENIINLEEKSDRIYFEKKLINPPEVDIDEVLRTHIEKEQLIEALREAGNNKTKAAELLNVHRSTIYERINKYKLD